MPEVIDAMAIRANLRIERRAATDGRLLGVIEEANLSPTVARNLLRDFLFGDAVTGLNYFAAGTGSTAPAATDTQLGVEVFRDTWTTLTKTADGVLQMQYYLGTGSANGSTIAEAGAFGNGATAAANSGTLYARATFTPTAKTNAEAWTFTWTFTLTPSTS